jgi:hypothetical protein
VIFIIVNNNTTELGKALSFKYFHWNTLAGIVKKNINFFSIVLLVKTLHLKSGCQCHVMRALNPLFLSNKS